MRASDVIAKPNIEYDVFWRWETMPRICNTDITDAQHSMHSS